MQAGNGSNSTFDNITFVDSAAVRLHSSAASAGDLFINAITDLAVGGNLSITATTGDITQGAALAITGAATFITTANNRSIILDQSNAFGSHVTMQAGDGSAAFNDITFVDSAAVKLHSSAGSNGDLFINAGTDLAISGDLNITATTGNITQGAEVAVGATSTFTTSASNGTITLNDADNAFTGAVAINTDGSSGNAAIVNGVSLILAASTVDGTLTATAATGDISNTGVLAIAGATTFITTTNNRSIVLDQNNVFASTVTMQAGNGSNATFNNITFVNSAAVRLHSSAASAGDLFINASTDLAVGGNLSITANTGDITEGAALAITGASTFITTANNRSIILDQSNAFGSHVTMKAGDGSAAFNNITFVDSADVRLHSSAASAGDLFINAGTDLDVDGSLNITATTGNITQGSELDVGTTATFTTSASNGTITLNDADNTFTGAVALNTNGSSGNATIKNDRALLLAASSVGGAFSATATTGNITQSGALAITGTSTLVTSANHGTITLTNTGNALTGKLLITTNDDSPGTLGTVNIDGGTTNLIIGLSTIDGNLTLRSGGTITDDGIATVRGTITATTNLNNKIITLDELAVTGALTLAPDGTGAVTIVNAAGLNLAASTMGGTFSGTATTGDISDSGNLTITGNSIFTAADTQSVILNNNNSFTGAVTFAALSGNLKNVTITNTMALDLGAMTLAQVASSGGNLTVTTSGALTDSGALVIPGTTTITATGQVVDLDHTSNNFATILFGSSSNAVSSVEVVDTNAIIIGASKSTGNFTVTAGGDVTDGDTVTVGGNLSVVTSASNGLINMGTLEVDGIVALTTNGNGAATIVNDAAIEFAVSTIGGALSATATTGNITQNGALTITGTSTLVTSANHGTITLANTGNAMTGKLLITTNDDSPGTVGTVNIDGGTTNLIIGLSTIDGNLTLRSGGTITDDGIATVRGTLTATTDLNNKIITLDELAVTGAFTLAPHGTGAVTIVNAAGLNLAASTMGGTFSGTATTGDISDSGNLAITGARPS